MSCLDGIVVLDLARHRPGAYTAMFLADFGAKVIRIDPPVPSTRAFGSRPIGQERAAAFLVMDRNKQSIVLNLKTDAGREVLLRLARRADVLIEGFQPGVMERLGVGYPLLRDLNPRLIYCSLSGFGQDGPYANIPAHDMNYTGLGGALSLIGERNGKPSLPSNFVADMAGAGLHAAVGILLALMERTKSGEGQFVDISYLDGVISLLAYSASDFFESGIVPKRGVHRVAGGAPWGQVYECKDGEYVTVGADPSHWPNLCRALGREDLLGDIEPAERSRADEVIAEFAAIFRTRTRDEWSQFFWGLNACVTPVNHLDETFRDPQVVHRRMVVELDHPTVGPVKQTGIPIKLSRTPGEIKRLGVPPGADAETVLADLGYSPHEVQCLRESGALG